MLPNPFFRSDATTSATRQPMSGALKMEHDSLYWGQQQPVDHLAQNVYPLQNLQAAGGSEIPTTNVGFQYRTDSSSSSSSHLQALRDFMSQGNSNVSLYSQQLVPPPPLLLHLGDDAAQFRPALPDVGVRTQYQGDLFGSERTPHRTQFQRESHILAERQRREEMNDKFSSLRAMLPKSSKKDKASIVGDTINYVMELEKTLKQLQTCKAKRKGYYLAKEGRQKQLPSSAETHEAATKQNVDTATKQNTDTDLRRSVQVEVQALGQQAVVKVVCPKSPKLVLRILTALEQCKVEVLQSNVTTLGDNAVHFFTIELAPGLSATAEELIAALEAAAAANSSS